MSHPQPAIGGINPGRSVPSAVPTDVPSALQVVLSALQSSSGITRLTTQAGTAAEVGALVLLTGDATVLGAQAAAIATNAGIAGITSASTYDELVTAVANS